MGQLALKYAVVRGISKDDAEEHPVKAVTPEAACLCAYFSKSRHDCILLLLPPFHLQSWRSLKQKLPRRRCRSPDFYDMCVTVLRSFWMQVDACVQTDNVDLKDLRLMVPEKVVAVEVDDKKQIIKYIPIEPRHFWNQKSGANPVFMFEPLVTTCSFAFLWHPRKKSWPLKRKCLLWRKLFEQ